MVIGFIYKIYDNTNGNVYYGSTKDTLSRRMTGHRTLYKRWVDGKRTSCCKSFDIIKNGDYAYSLVEEVEYADKLVLRQRERWYIENNECVNKNVPARTLKESCKAYREEHKEERNEWTRKWRDDNVEKIAEYNKKYNERKTTMRIGRKLMRNREKEGRKRRQK